MKKTLTVLAGIVLIAAIGLTGCNRGGSGSSGSSAAASGTLPRSETFYMNGILWTGPSHWNPYNTGTGTFGITPNQTHARILIYETLFMFNMLDNKLHPLLADSYEWNGQSVTVRLDRNAKWWDGQQITAADVVSSYELQADYQTPFSAYPSYISSVIAQGNDTVVITANPANWNPKMIETLLGVLYITPKSVMDRVRAQIGADRMALSQWPNLEPVASGPYKPMAWDETRAVLERVESYWGKDSPKFGKLPAPRYVAHNIYNDNAAGDAAFRAGEVDMSQQFIASVWTLPASVETYIPQAPYYIPGQIPFVIYNTQRPGLDDPVVRKAIAMSIDYTTIAQNAMSGYSAQMNPSIMLPTPAEQALVDANAIRPYQWSTDLQTAVDEANALLDQNGWARGADGIRAKGGVRLGPWQAECPTGWSDWNATLEVISQAGRQIGVEINTYFPQQTVWQSDMDNGTFDLIMNNIGPPGPASPWNRAYGVMGSMDLPPEGTPNRIGNYGRWINAQANDLINRIMTETDQAALRQLWTQVNILYLQEVPAIATMYRPAFFHTTNTVVWTGFPKFGDSSNIPPTLCTDGYGIKALYSLSAKR